MPLAHSSWAKISLLLVEKQLLEGIGALTVEDLRKSGSAYQDDVTLPLSSLEEFSGNDDPEPENITEEEGKMLTALEKVC